MKLKMQGSGSVDVADSAFGAAFNEALVHQVVYSQISEPRRKLMHLRIAQFLDGRDDPDGTISLEIAHHASVGGDAAMAVRATTITTNDYD